MRSAKIVLNEVASSAELGTICHNYLMCGYQKFGWGLIKPNGVYLFLGRNRWDAMDTLKGLIEKKKEEGL